MSSETTQAAIARIEQLAQLGLFDAADAACRELLASAPGEHKGWVWLGMLAIARGQAAEGEPALRQAIAIWPNDPRYWNTLALALRMQGKAGEGEVAAKKALSLADSSEYWGELGNCLFDQQRWQDASHAYQQALARSPSEAQLWTNFAAAEHSLGRLDAAQSAFEQSLRLAPGDANTTLRYALLLVQRGHLDRGIELVRGVLAQSPDLAPAWLLLGNAERLRDRLHEAQAAYRRAQALVPGDRDARFNLALVLLQQLAPDEAETWIRPLVANNPNDAEALTVLGGALHAQARIDEAISALSRSVELAANPISHSKLLVALHYSEKITPEQLLLAHQQWDAAHARPLFHPSPPVSSDSVRHNRLRIGLAAVDFSSGPTGFLALRGIECLDRSQCSVICYSDRGSDDEYTTRFRARADDWRQTMGLTDDELAKQVRRDEIDVFVDLGGHVGRRLLTFARSPAPLQITWLGYVGTTGMAAMDGLLADRFHVREGEEAWYAENVLRMPNDYVCYGPPTQAPGVNSLPALATGRVLFGCFNNPAKYSPHVLDAWATILRRVPSAGLFLKYGGLDQTAAQNRFRGQLEQRGVSPDRVICEGWSDHAKLLASYNRVDLALDTQPYSGGLTTCEALWMGVPVVTYPGQGFASRHSTSHMTNAGFGQFVATDVEGYVELAITWASRLDELGRLRGQMRDRVSQSPLCDGLRFARDLLALLRPAWEAKVR